MSFRNSSGFCVAALVATGCLLILPVKDDGLAPAGTGGGDGGIGGMSGIMPHPDGGVGGPCITNADCTNDPSNPSLCLNDGTCSPPVKTNDCPII
ncbi:MAG TPA: hypothetical protein VGL13_15430, partial [Polyangiaceae bacterium]